MSLKYSLPVDYGSLSWSERKKVREQYIEEQDGKCFFCDCDLKEPPPKEVTDREIIWSYFPPQFLKYPVHLQHDHTTGLTEGAVHAYCNAVMWQHHGR